MNNKPFVVGAGIGCALLLVLLIIVIPLSLFSFSGGTAPRFSLENYIPVTGERNTGTSNQVDIPTIEAAPAGQADSPGGNSPDSQALVDLYERMNPGVVNIQTLVEQQGGVGASAGSGFIMDEQGHIITNNHVVAGATNVTVIFYNGFETRAEVIGTDDDSDLAVIRAENLAEGAYALDIGDSDQVRVGEWVVAIGNPFGLGTSMSIGIVSAVERAIASGATPYNIPQAIQTDAAINPGNSGGPLISLSGNVIGVNAQIATSTGTGTNSGVGFAIPANVVRRVAPVLIENGSYQWPYLGIRGDDVSLVLAQLMGLESQNGAYIHEVTPGGPAEEAGLQGSTGTDTYEGIEVPVGGDIVIEADGEPIETFNDLLVIVAYHDVGDTVNFTIIRDGETMEVPVTLAARPDNFENETFPEFQP